MIKKVVVTAGVLCLLAGTLVTTNYVCGRNVIRKYKSGVYENSGVNMVLGFTQPYIYHYNQGNIYYSKGDYTGAEEEYSRVLEYKPSGDTDCRTRINLALSMVKPIDADSVTADNLDETLDILEGAKKVLLENGCAHDEDDDGHNSDAQTLKNEIDEFEQTLKDKVKDDQDDQKDDQEDQDDPQNDDSEDDTSEEQTSEQEDDIKQQLEQIQGDSLNERNQEMDSYETYKEGFQYYDGQTW